ncbi:MAG: PepB aminopeptidase [Parasphingorhabdus sp.]|jgi:PepB aminopeptidase
MLVSLSDNPAPAQWGENALLSTIAEGFNIHLLAHQDREDRIQQAARKISVMGVIEVSLTGSNWTLEDQWAFALGYLKVKHCGVIQWAQAVVEDAEKLDQRLQIHNWLRSMTHATPEDQSPLKLAQDTVEFLNQVAPGDITHEIICGDDLLKQGWVGVHGVGRGSERPPVMLRLEYCPAECHDDPVAAVLVGKGLIYDSGGYSLKKTEHMFLMKTDMGGAATVTAALASAIRAGLRKRIVLILCCAENLISGRAYKNGDILNYKNGVSVEIANTDAEGRVVLADGLIMAGETGAALVINAATLTGAAQIALGNDYNAIFALDSALQARALDYARRENERHWALPLEKFHQHKCPSLFADTCNSRPVPGGGSGGASNAAGFLSRFAPNDGKGWLHFDLSGSFHAADTNLYAGGASGLGVRTIARTLLEEL